MLHAKGYTKELAEKLMEAFKNEELSVKAKELKGEGEFEVIATREVVDRDGEIVKVSGIDIANFLKNPVILWGHDYWSFPIGAATDVRIQGDQMIVKGVFAPTEQAQIARLLYDTGFLKTVSIGFIGKERQGNLITKCELLELSFVPVPSNPEALDARESAEFAKKILQIDSIMKTATEAKESKLAPLDFELDQTADMKTEAFALMKGETGLLAHHAEIDGSLKTVWKSVEAGMKSLLGGELDEALDEEEKKSVYEHLAVHYKEFDKEPPALKSYTLYELDIAFSQKGEAGLSGVDENALAQLEQEALANLKTAFAKLRKQSPVAQPEVKEGRVLSSKNRTLVTECIDVLGNAQTALQQLLDASEPQKGLKAEEADQALKAAQAIDKGFEQVIRFLKTAKTEGVA